MSTVMPDDALHWRRAVNAGGLLRAFNDAGVLDAADVHVATRLTTQAGEGSEIVALALALAVRALRSGSVCVDLRTVASDLDDPDQPQLPWPDPEHWLAELRAEPVGRCARGSADLSATAWCIWTGTGGRRSRSVPTSSPGVRTRRPSTTRHCRPG